MKQRNKVSFVVTMAIILVAATLSLCRNAHADQPQTVTNPGTIIRGGATVKGSIVQSALGTPSIPVITNVGTAGSTTYTYACAASDVNGNDTIPSSTTTTTTGNATLSATNFNVIVCGGTVGAWKYKVFKADTAHLLGTCNSSSPTGGGSCEVVDNSTGAGTAYTANVVDQTGGAGSSNPAQHVLTRQTTGLCSSSGATNAVCGEPTITGLPFLDANYNVVANCVGTPTTGVQAGVAYIVKAAATAGLASTAQVFIGGPGAGTVACAEVDVDFFHD